MGNEVELLEHWRELALEKQRKVLDQRSDRRFGCDEDIDFSDIPEATVEQMAQAVLRVGGVPVERGKQQVNMMLDAFIVEYFKRIAELNILKIRLLKVDNTQHTL